MARASSHKSQSSRAELRFSLRAVSRGIAIGKAVLIFGRRNQFSRTKIPQKSAAAEVRRFRSALAAAQLQLSRLIAKEQGGRAKLRNGIFEAHLMMISDSEFERRVCDSVIKERMNAEWAVHSVCRNLSQVLRTSDDAHLRERALDIEDVGDRILAALAGSRRGAFASGSIAVAADVTPSVIAELGKQGLKGIVADHGGWTSHAFIIAREIGLPAVTGLRSATRRISDGDELIVDGYRGEVIVNPTAETKRRYKQLKSEGFGKSPVRSTARGPLKTLDGVPIIIRANVDAPKGFAAAKKSGAQGVGLYRSEVLYDAAKGFPSEKTQINAYRSVAMLAGKNGAKIRTYDLGVERLLDPNHADGRNPALGLRGIRLMSEHPEEFRIQIRSLLKASVGRKIEIVIPMLSDIGELRSVKEIIKKEQQKLRRQGVDVSTPSIGAMIEVPSAVLMAKEFAAESDFLSLGTNDLVQYLLAVDRDNGSVADFYRTLHPAVLRAVKTVLDAGSAAGKPVIVCGEMAASPVYVAVLIGLGARELSMNAGAMQRIRSLVRGVAEEECAAIAARLLMCATVAEVEDEVAESFASTWASLFPSGTLPEIKSVEKPSKSPK